MSAIGLSAASLTEPQGMHAVQQCQIADAACRASSERGQPMERAGAWATLYASTDSPDARVLVRVAWRRRAGLSACFDASHGEPPSALYT